MDKQQLDGYCDFADGVFEWCLRNALAMEHGGNLENSAGWALVAARIAADFGHGYLCSVPLESLLGRIAGRSAPLRASLALHPAGKRRRWLHVFSSTWSIGGHTAFGRRWMEHNPFGDTHHLVVTDQWSAKVEPGVRSAVERSGGRVYSLKPRPSLLDRMFSARGEPSLLARAVRLREIASRQADVVVLHTHHWDVIPTLAFAAERGPPVLLVNHADHAFWVGAGIADMVIDIRESGRHLTAAFRGARRSAMLPLLLPNADRAPYDRTAAARRLSGSALMDSALVLLTIGSPHKYRPVPGLDFLAALRKIVEQVPDCAIVAVGPALEDPSWKQLHRDSGGRITAVGYDVNLRTWHAATDVYLEGFPIGSYTALLEVALAGRAFVRKPLLVSPAVLPVDRGALAEFEPPETVNAYVAMAVDLCNSPAHRELLAERGREAVRRIHCGEGWNSRLEALCKDIPDSHGAPADREVPPIPASLREYWGWIYGVGAADQPFAAAFRRAEAMGLAPKADAGMIAAMDRARSRGLDIADTV